jgi:hypothetical protein
LSPFTGYKVRQQKKEKKKREEKRKEKSITIQVFFTIFSQE